MMTIITQFVFYFLALIAIIVLSVLLVLQWKKHKNEISEIKDTLDQSKNEIKIANDRLMAVFQISQKFVEAENEGEIINELLSLSMNLTGANGASFIPFDNHGQPMTATRLGNFPFPIPDAWLEYMASPVVRGECMNCTRHGSIVETCPLMDGPFPQTHGIYCLPLRRMKTEFGMLNLYLPDTHMLDESTRVFIGSLLDATALAIDGVRMREDERDTLTHLRSIQQHSDSKLLIHELLDDACTRLRVDYALVVTGNTRQTDKKFISLQGETFISDEMPGSIIEKINEITQQIISKGDYIYEIAKIDVNNKNSLPIHILGMPVFSYEKILKGIFFVVRQGEEAYQNGQYKELRIYTSQVGLILHLTDQMSEIAYKTLINERIRLAREIHDGLAQTLGYLKLLVAQMKGYIDQRDFDRVNRTALTFSQTISNAYQDAREAIDGLRVLPSTASGQPSSDLSIWLEQTVSEFQENQEIHPYIISLEKDDLNLNLSTEIQAQLIRIVQEALSNIRKHAHANKVVISIHKCEGDVIMEIRDDGMGFSPEEIPGPSQHGLKGMRERAELIGARFQIKSVIGSGTTVGIRLPDSTCKQLEKVI
jgi:two-component system, NarL family, nitrate/nitrite sensor histidine kinase NarX